MIYAGRNLRNNMLKMFNKFWLQEKIPEELYTISVKSLYKGKGRTTDITNQRGLFLASNVLKLYKE